MTERVAFCKQKIESVMFTISEVEKAAKLRFDASYDGKDAETWHELRQMQTNFVQWVERNIKMIEVVPDKVLGFAGREVRRKQAGNMEIG